MGAQRRGSIRIGIVEDHPVFRLGLRRALERQSDVEVCWELGSATGLEAAMQKAPVDVMLIDVYLGSGTDGITATRDVHVRWPEVKVAAMSASLDTRVGIASKRAGASAFLAKSMPVAEMVASIRALADPTNRNRSARRGRSGSRARVDGLSARQGQVLEHMRLGHTNKEIAARLGVSVATVNKHVHEVLAALGVRNRTQAAAKARSAGD